MGEGRRQDEGSTCTWEKGRRSSGGGTVACRGDRVSEVHPSVIVHVHTSAVRRFAAARVAASRRVDHVAPIASAQALVLAVAIHNVNLVCTHRDAQLRDI
jgi:hypothetical protein